MQWSHDVANYTASTFGLRTHPCGCSLFRIAGTFDDNPTWVVVEINTADGWTDYSRCTVSELGREIT